MGLFQDAVHLTGDVVAPVTYAAGAVTGSNALKQAATNIASPTATLSNPAGLLKSGSPAFTGSGADYPTTTAKVATPSKGATATSNNTTTGGAATGGSSGSTSTSTSTAANYAPVLAEASTALGQALQALNSSNAAVDATGNQQTNVLNSNQASANNTYQNDLTTDAQALATAEQGAKTQGNSDLTSLMRLIGGMGGGGSSVEEDLIPKLVNNSVQSNITGADTTKATNDQSADSVWNTFLGNLNNQRQQLADQVNSQKATNTAAYGKEVQELNNAVAAGKSATVDPTSLDEMVDNIVSAIPNVVNFTPSYTGTTPVYNSPQLSTYEMTPTQIAASAGTVAPVSGASVIPYLASLTTNQQKLDANGNPIATTTTPTIATS